VEDKYWKEEVMIIFECDACCEKFSMRYVRLLWSYKREVYVLVCKDCKKWYKRR
jgi:uncharacterized protein YbaR (Trm112 family)